MRLSRMASRALLAATGLIGLSACTYDDGYYGGGVSYSSGYYGCDPYGPFDSYYGCDYGYGFGNIGYSGGWWSDYYYPGYGIYIFDRGGHRHTMRDEHRRYWSRQRAEWYRHHHDGRWRERDDWRRDHDRYDNRRPNDQNRNWREERERRMDRTPDRRDDNRQWQNRSDNDPRRWQGRNMEQRRDNAEPRSQSRDNSERRWQSRGDAVAPRLRDPRPDVPAYRPAQGGSDAGRSEGPRLRERRMEQVRTPRMERPAQPRSMEQPRAVEQPRSNPKREGGGRWRREGQGPQ